MSKIRGSFPLSAARGLLRYFIKEVFMACARPTIIWIFAGSYGFVRA